MQSTRATEANGVSAAVFCQTGLITVLVSVVFVMCRSVYDHIRRQCSYVNVVVIGGGPVGLLSAMIATRHDKVSRAFLYEERNRHELLKQPQQVITKL